MELKFDYKVVSCYFENIEDEIQKLSKDGYRIITIVRAIIQQPDYNSIEFHPGNIEINTNTEHINGIVTIPVNVNRSYIDIQNYKIIAEKEIFE